MLLEIKEERDCCFCAMKTMGKGFEMSEEKAFCVGLGLRNLDNRVEMLAGTSKTISALKARVLLYELKLPY